MKRLLPDTACYSSEAYGAYVCLPMNMREIGKGGDMNRNEGLRTVLRCKLNKLVRRTKGYSKMDRMLTLSIALEWMKLGWI